MIINKQYETVMTSSNSLLDAGNKMTARVNKMMLDGWEPLGGISICTSMESTRYCEGEQQYDNDYHMSQAMIKTEYIKPIS